MKKYYIIFNKIYTKVWRFNTGTVRSVKAKKNIGALFGLKSVSILIGLIYVPIILDFLDKEKYGIWLTLVSIITWINFFDIGLGNGLRNYLVKAFAEKDEIIAKTLVSTSYAILSIIFLLLAIMFFLINPLLDWNRLLNTNIIGIHELSSLALIVFTMFCLKFILKIIGVVLLADQRPALKSSFETIANIFSLLFIYILTKISTDGSLITLGIILSINPVVVLITASFILYNGRYKSIRPSFKYINLRYSRNIMSLGIKFFFLQITGLIVFASSNFIITQVLGPEHVTPFSIAKKYFSVSFMLYLIIMSPMWSAVSDAYYKNDFGWLRNTLRKLNYLSIIFSVGIIAMYLISDFVYNLWFGNKLTISNDISISMALFSIISVIGSPYSNFINGFGKLKLGMFIGTIKLITFIPIAIFFTKSSGSPAGAMFATCLINSISLILEPIQVNKIVNNKAYGIWNK